MARHLILFSVCLYCKNSVSLEKTGKYAILVLSKHFSSPGVLRVPCRLSVHGGALQVHFWRNERPLRHGDLRDTTPQRSLQDGPALKAFQEAARQVLYLA